eukprot:TRINITY_DN51513_c0_g1_i1.p2 TRINITY_DN51513_c0_g1~~TRINITY_DN51513_c0_g1_i1.p2  ORF type:complete len:350 (+),score=107.82 TRINITY_DN51513_c0_g1_i1:75-1124(+)
MAAAARSGPRWGIIGAGMICNDFCCALVKHGAAIASVAARDAGKAAAFAKRFGAASSVAEYRKIWENPEIDVVYIGTHSASHFELAMSCVQHGKAVLVEKPISLNAREAAALVSAARHRGVFLMEGMWTRCFPVVRRVRQELGAQSLGACHMVQADFHFKGPTDPKHRLWDPKLGGGAALDIGVYPIGAALLAFGSAMPDLVGASGQTRHGVDSEGALSLTWNGKGSAALVFGLDSPSPEEWTYACEQGWIRVMSPAHCPTRAEIVRKASRGGAPEVTVVEEPLPGAPDGLGVNFPNSEGMLYQVQEVERCLAAGLSESPDWTHAESITTMRIIDELYSKLGVRLPSSL